MSRIRSEHTAPELTVRRIARSLGYRFRLHVRSLPGTPDIVFPRLRSVIEVRGCFWHQHGCAMSHVPLTRRDYWLPKLLRNRERDRKSLKLLRKMGWRVLVIWECQTRDPALVRRIEKFLSS